MLWVNGKMNKTKWTGIWWSAVGDQTFVNLEQWLLTFLKWILKILCAWNCLRSPNRAHKRVKVYIFPQIVIQINHIKWSKSCCFSYIQCERKKEKKNHNNNNTKIWRQNVYKAGPNCCIALHCIGSVWWICKSMSRSDKNKNVQLYLRP